MANDGTGRRFARDLFAERQVHLRSGDESRYLVLTRSLQIGVTVGVLAIPALHGLASYNAIAKHLALVAQERVLADEVARRVAQEAQAAAELATLRQRSEAAEGEILRLSAALDQAEAGRAAAIAASTEAGSRAAELQAALAATMQESRRRAEDDARADPASPPGTREQELLAEITGLRAELERVNREALTLRRSATAARQALRDLRGGAEQAQAQADEPGAAAPAADEVRRLQRYLADARSTIATLSADLEAPKGSGAGPATDAAVELATREEQLGAAQQRALQLGRSLAAPPANEVGDPTPLPSPPAPR